MNTECNCKKKCAEPCGCPEPVFSVESMPDDPTVLRFNVNGKSVWYDFSQVVKTAETATTVALDPAKRTFNHYGEKSTQTMTAKELGSIFHLADIGDIDENSITDYGILNYRKANDCPEGCEGTDNKWQADNPVKLGETSLAYVLGSDAEGKLESLMPPTSASSFSYLAWAAAGKAKWVKPTIVSNPPVKDGKITRLYLDENTGEIVGVRENA